MQMDSGPASAYAPHDGALLDYFRDHTSATLSCYQDVRRYDVPGSTVRAISVEGLKSIDPRGECWLRVKLDKTQSEHNASAVGYVAAVTTSRMSNLSGSGCAVMSPRLSQPSRGNDVIVPVICPTRQMVSKIGGLCRLLPVTLHGVVFGILFWRSTKHQAEPDLIMLW